MNAIYCKDDIQRIFDREKILMGNNDVFPEYKAVEIFGSDAVRFAEKTGHMYLRGYGIGDYTSYGFTIKGIEIAATYRNVCYIRDKMREGESIDQCQSILREQERA